MTSPDTYNNNNTNGRSSVGSVRTSYVPTTTSTSTPSSNLGNTMNTARHNKISVLSWFISQFGRQPEPEPEPEQQEEEAQQNSEQAKEEEEGSKKKQKRWSTRSARSSTRSSYYEEDGSVSGEDILGTGTAAATPLVVIPSELSFVITAIESRHMLKVEELRDFMLGAEQCLVEQDDEFELAKVLFLVECCLAQNRAIIRHIIQQAIYISTSIEYWKIRKAQPYWFLYEKTPVYWSHWLYNFSKTSQIVSPMAETDAKLAILNKLDHQYMEQLAKCWHYSGIFFTATDIEQLKQHIYENAISNYNFLNAPPALRSDTLIHKLEQAFGVAYETDSTELKEEIDLDDKSLRGLYKIQLTSLQNFENFYEFTQLNLRKAGKPSYFSRNWLKICAGTLGFYMSTKLFFGHQQDIFQFAKEAQITLTRFWQDYVIRPLRNVYEVIRYTDKQHIYVHVVDMNALNSDIESLGRLVTDYVRSHPTGNIVDYDQITAMAKRGDLGPILPDFEKAVTTPIKSAVFGELLRLLLIQVQKSKVDIERALLAIDKLLQANELNFEFLALIPAGIFLGLVYHQFSQFYNRTSGSVKALYSNIRAIVRQSERILNKNTLKVNTFSSNLNNYDLGVLLLNIHRLHDLGLRIPSPNHRKDFLEDLEDIEHLPDVKQKLRTITRMYRSYPFLSAV